MNLLLLICDAGGFFINPATYGANFRALYKTKSDIGQRDKTRSEIY